MDNYDVFTLNDRIKDGKELQLTINTSLDYIQTAITRLTEEVNKKNANFDILKEICFQLISKLPLPIHNFNNSFILRSRPNFNGEIFGNISDVSYNPFPDRISLNRFNLKGEPAFYGAAPISSDKANGALTTICESFKELFDIDSTLDYQYLTIGKWEVIKPITLILLTFYDEAWRKSKHIQNINPMYAEFMGLSCNEEDNRKCHLFFSYFSEAAGRRFNSPNNYLLTTAFYHALREYYGLGIGILYSSSSTDNYGLNIVLSKEIIDASYLQLSHVVMYKCVRDPLDRKSFQVYPCCIGSDVDKNGEFQLLNLI